ncbi:MAG TPA: LLM class flavin-dependent oxidoreductase [Bacillota bacterium]
MKLSILDQSPIAEGKSAQDALQASIELAQKADELGYTRYWMAEHHDMTGLACPAPDMMLSAIGSSTRRIRIGAGAVLLPHYRPFNIAERYNLLATLYPGRIDLGIGRAPGGSAEVTMALSENFLENVRKMPQKLQQLLQFLYDDFPKDNMFSKISPSPVPLTSPQPWVLGTSEKSAQMAAEKGLPYTFGHFMSSADGPTIVKEYSKKVKNNPSIEKPIVAVSAICAETTEEAEKLALSSQLWSVLGTKAGENGGIPTIQHAQDYPYTAEDLKTVQKQKKASVVGNPQQVKQQLEQLQVTYGVDEFMLLTITHDYEARLRSYELIAEEILNK